MGLFVLVYFFGGFSVMCVVALECVWVKCWGCHKREVTDGVLCVHCQRVALRLLKNRAGG